MRWLAALLIICGVAFAQSSQPPVASGPPNTQNANALAADERGTEKVPLAVKVIPAPKSEAEKHQEEQERREKSEIDRKLAVETQRIADYTYYLGAFTAALFCSAIFQIILFYVQLRYMRTSAIDTGIAAVAAKSSAETARLSMVASNRAYVHHNGCRWISHRDTKDGHIFWRIRPRWINSGNSPTRRLNVHIKYELVDVPLAPDYKFDVPQSAVPIFSTIAPHAEIESQAYEIDGEQLAAVQDGKKHFYIWGVVRYRDVFPASPEHVTKFCVYARLVTGDPRKYWNEKTNPVEIVFATYHRHNCSDEDCGPD